MKRFTKAELTAQVTRLEGTLVAREVQVRHQERDIKNLKVRVSELTAMRQDELRRASIDHLTKMAQVVAITMCNAELIKGITK